MSLIKDLDQYFKTLQQTGWRVEKTNGGHYKLTHEPSGGFQFTSSTPSDWRALENLKSRCRKIEKEYQMTLPQVKEKPAFGLSEENQRKLAQVAAPRVHVVEGWKPREDEEDEDRERRTRTSQKANLDMLYAYKRKTMKTDTEICKALGYSDSAHHDWYKNKQMPQIVHNCLKAWMEIIELQEMLDGATTPAAKAETHAPVVDTTDPLAFIKQGLSILNTSIREKGLQAFIKEDGQIGAKVVTTVEL